MVRRKLKSAARRKTRSPEKQKERLMIRAEILRAKDKAEAASGHLKDLRARLRRS